MAQARATRIDPCVQFPRGAEVVERLRYAGYVPTVARNKFFVRKGNGARNKVEYAKWIDCFNNADTRREAINYLRLTTRRVRRR